MKTGFTTFDNAANSRVLDTQELDSVSGGYFSSLLNGDPRTFGLVTATNVKWSPAMVPHDKTGNNAMPNGWTYDWPR